MAAAVAEEAAFNPGDHQARAPNQHRQRGAPQTQAPRQLPGEEQVAELAVLVGLLGIEGRLTIHHREARPAAQALQVAQARRQTHPTAGRAGIVDLRSGDHNPGGSARIKQRKKPLAERLVGEMVHRDGELVVLGGTAWLGGTGLLEAGIEHQGVDRRAPPQQLGGTVLDARQISEIAGGGVKGGGSPCSRRGHRSGAGLRGERLERGFTGALRQQPLHGGRRGGLVAARQGEGMARTE